MSDIKKACVIGWPISHSRSPTIFSYWLNKYELEGEYSKQAVKPEDFSEFVKNMSLTNEYVGANVTVPHKEVAFSIADEPDEAARAVNAANTLWFSDGKIYASNTDTFGFMTHLNRSAPDWKHLESPVTILGAGGAAKAIIFGLLEQGVTELRILNRTKQRAEELEKIFGNNVKVFDYSDPKKALIDCSLLINTTTLGMTGSHELEIDLSPMNSQSIVADIVYSPLETQLLNQANERGFKTVDGLGMLLHQAVPGFEIWFNKRPEVTSELRDLIISDLGE